MTLKLFGYAGTMRGLVSRTIVTCIRNRRLGFAKVVLDGTRTSKDAVLSITLILEIGIFNKFCSRLRRSLLIFQYV